MISYSMAEYVLIIKNFCKYYLFNLIILDIKLRLTIANPQWFLNFNDIIKLSESFEQIDSKYWTNWQGVLNKLAESFEISENRIFCQILLEIGSFLHQNFTKCSIFADSL